MPNFYDEDDECTADAGVMGHVACHLYPNCGCGSQSRINFNYVKYGRPDPTYTRPVQKEEGNLLHDLLDLLERRGNPKA